jgi:hypothetical protein
MSGTEAALVKPVIEMRVMDPPSDSSSTFEVVIRVSGRTKEPSTVRVGWARVRIAPSKMVPSRDSRAIGDVTFASLWREPS